MYKPDGYTDVSPCLVVDDAQATLDFFADVFSAATLRNHRSEDGEIVHAEARIGDSVVIMGQKEGGPAAHVHVYVADPGDSSARAFDAGAKVVKGLERKDDGDRRGGVKDQNGTTWWIARQETR